MRVFDVVRNMFMAVWEFIKRIIPNPRDTVESRNFKTTILFLIGCVVFMFAVAVVAFIAYIQPVDETVIPDMKGTDFREAIGILQNKKLQPLFRFEYTNVPQDKDLIMKQEPEASAKVRIGSRVTLWVSSGVMYDRVGNYVNKTLSEVEELFRKSFNKDRQIIAVKKPVNYISHQAQAGTILAQYPPPGTPLGDRTLYVELTVSKGLVQTEIVVGDYEGKPYQSALADLQAKNIPFVFNVETANKNDVPGQVTAQNIPPGAKIGGGVLLVLQMFKPDPAPANMVFGLFRATIPDFGAPVTVKVESELLGKRTLLLSEERAGGELALPYVLDKDASLILTLAGEEKKPEKAQAY
ncbi:MAG: PASTA domain-containing protein [Spirochaetales bacterium]|nr:PASTA domain-containing protein [Spirochaetales bacterium]